MIYKEREITLKETKSDIQRCYPNYKLNTQIEHYVKLQETIIKHSKNTAQKLRAYERKFLSMLLYIGEERLN